MAINETLTPSSTISAESTFPKENVGVSVDSNNANQGASVALEYHTVLDNWREVHRFEPGGSYAVVPIPTVLANYRFRAINLTEGEISVVMTE